MYWCMDEIDPTSGHHQERGVYNNLGVLKYPELLFFPL